MSEHNVHPAIIALLRDLPQPIKPWTSADRERFLEAFTAMVKYLYPPNDKSPSE